MDTQEVILENLKCIAQMVRNTWGNRCEVAVHDLRNVDHSLVYIVGDVTGRTIGAEPLDFEAEILDREIDAEKDITDYKTKLKDGRIVRSSISFIRDENGKRFAALWVICDITDLLNFTTFLQGLTGTNYHDEGQEDVSQTIQDTIGAIVSQAISKLGKQPATMSLDERVRFVGLLEEKGAFMIKGSVDYIAAVLGVSKFTVYNYLNRYKANIEINGNFYRNL